MKVVLSVAGSDSSGGAGIQADLKTMTAHGVYAMTAITAMTAQNTTGVRAVFESPTEFLEQQIEACLSDIPVDALKIGMLPCGEQVRVVVNKINEYGIKNVVIDPVMISSSGKRLMKEEACQMMEEMLFPLATVVTPNIPEAECLGNMKISNTYDMGEAARYLSNKYGCAVLIKGGHSTGDAVDVLCENGEICVFCGLRLENKNTHGTGCTLSSAIASNLAKGKPLKEAIRLAKEYVFRAINDGMKLGKGAGPLNHMVGI